MSKKLDPRGVVWPIGQINKDRLMGQPLDQLEVFCNISKDIVKQETCSSHNLVHNGSVFHYFYNPNGLFYCDMRTEMLTIDPTERLMFLIEVTLQVHNENRNLMYIAEENDTLDHCSENAIAGAHFLGYNKLQSYIQQCNPNGDSILHVLAKKGNNFQSIINC